MCLSVSRNLYYIFHLLNGNKHMILKLKSCLHLHTRLDIKCKYYFFVFRIHFDIEFAE